MKRHSARSAGRLRPGRLLALALIPSAALGGIATTPTPSGAAVGATHLVTGYVDSLALAHFDAPAPATHVMDIGISLQRPNPAGETALYNAIYSSTSPLYHHFLTPAQFNHEFGVPSAETSAVRNWLTAGGLTITSTSGGDYFTANGTVTDLDKLFNVSIGTYTYNHHEFLANNRPPTVPVDLPIDAVAGLDTVHKFSLNSLTRYPSATPSTTASTKAIGNVGPQPGDALILTPQDLWGVYNDPGAAALSKPGPESSGILGDTTDTSSNLKAIESTKYDLGQGQISGVFGEGETASVIASLRLFEARQGLPKVPVRVIHTEGGPATAYGDNTGSVEWYLDTQALTGMAPDLSQLDLYFAKSLYDPDVFADFSAWANDPNGPRQMNASFGECEDNPTVPLTGPLNQDPWGLGLGDEAQAIGDPVLRQATIEGRTLFAGSGDSGSGCQEVTLPAVGAANGLLIEPIPAVLWPCSSLYTVCVGGTVVTVKGSTYPESAEAVDQTAWTFTGGGSSYFVPEPAFQNGVAAIDHPCLSTVTGDPYPPGSAPICRSVPDVSDLSGNTLSSNGYFIYEDGEPASEGGTSLAGPLMAGQWTRIQAGASLAVQASGGLGYANPIIYRQAASADDCSDSLTATAAQSAACNAPAYLRDFIPITSSEFGAGNGLYMPGPGWNYDSGWGSINIGNFIQDVDHNRGETAPAPWGGSEAPAKLVTTAQLYGPPGWATDLVSAALIPTGTQGPLPLPLDNQSTNDDPALDITGATLTATAKSITATISGPNIGALPPVTDAEGTDFYVTWLYNGAVYFAVADESVDGGWTFSDGSTASGEYTDTTDSTATGSVDTDTGTITINVPTADVDKPKAGSMLIDIQAYDTALLGMEDSVDSFVPPSQDCSASTGICGVAESAGESVLVRPS